MSGVEAIRYGLLQGWSRITLSADEGRGILEALKRIPARTVTIAPDPDSQIRCRHAGGDPDCDCWPECPECGAGYDPCLGHDCLDDVPADELLDLAKELRDERDSLREELDALRPKAPEAGARPKDSCQTCDHENGCPNATQEGVCMYHDDAKRLREIDRLLGGA